MSYFADSVLSHIVKQIKKLQKSDALGHRLLIMIPALPEKDILSIASAIDSYRLRESDIALTLKIAAGLSEDWTPQGREKAERHEWVDDRGNLTYYRNLPPVREKLSVVVLCGADRVTDSAGLADFHFCDVDTIWKRELRKSFREWVNKKLHSVGVNDVDPDSFKVFDLILRPLFTYGRGDLLQISDWLKQLNFNGVANARDAQKIMLRELKDPFGLPSFIGFLNLTGRKTLAPYVDKAVSFFNYTLFLEAKEREKAEKAIDDIRSALNEDDQKLVSLLEKGDVHGIYSSGDDFLGGLENYVQTDNDEDREKLLSCDFVIIMDEILKFKKKHQKESKKQLRKVSGTPVAMLLSALWQSLREFYRKRLPSSYDHQIAKIDIQSHLFKHDIEAIDEEDIASVSDRNELARAYLYRLIGGIDGIVANHLTLKNSEDDEIEIDCSLLHDEISYRHSRTAEPYFEFSICIHYDDGEDPLRQRFAWRLPEHQAYRLSDSLLQRAREAMADTGGVWNLPVFHIPYYDEILEVSADDEIRRVLLHCIRDARHDETMLTNLLSEHWLSHSNTENDPLLPKLKALAKQYRDFITSSGDNGLLSTLFTGGEWTDLRKSYSDAYGEANANEKGLQSSRVGMLLRTFLIVQRRNPETGVAWHAEPFEESGIVTILHPALLEMFEAQVLYLFSCFNYAANKEIGLGNRSSAFYPRVWQTYLDLAEIQTPLSGLLYNEELNLDTSVGGQGLIHRIGMPSAEESTLSTRVLLNYGANSDDEEFSDTEMFRESSESNLLLRLMKDYFRLHPHARDGLSLAVFRNKDIQPVIAAVHHYLKVLAHESPKNTHYYALSPKRKNPYAISVTFFTESSDDADIAHWIDQWQERWEAAETETKYKLYRMCQFSVAHRIVEKENYRSFQNLIKGSFEADIAVFYNFIGTGKGVNSFEKVEPFDITTRTLKFPILEKACCAIKGPGEENKRARIISNRQFSLGALHSNLMHCLKNQAQQTGTVVIGRGDISFWRPIIDALHEKTEWVICIDPNIDDRLIKKSALPSGKEREIIGFGSGVGTHGEDNYTISTEQFSLSDINIRLSASIKSLYADAGWSTSECQDVANGILRVTRELSGLSLVRATGADDQYIRDFMAYGLVRKMLEAEGEVLCDTLISLDAYRHWFDLDDNSRRPDLMWLVARVGADKRLHLETRLIECKMANQAEQYIEKARYQIDNGLRILMPAFEPVASGGGRQLEDDRPDRRYWWMQLHRLIASKSEISKTQHRDVVSALERLAEGDFDIDWGAAVFAFWTDSDAEEHKQSGYWKTGIDGELIANVFAMGRQFVKNVAIGTSDFPVDWSSFEKNAEKVGGNICENMEDVELPLEDEDSDWADISNSSDDQLGEFSDLDLDLSHEEDSLPDVVESEDTGVIPTDSPERIHVPTDNSEKSSPIDRLAPSHVEIAEKVFSETISQRILLGNTIRGQRPVFWEFGHDELANRHMLIFGTSGMGKTYAIQCLLCELARVGQNSLIIDYTDGFVPSKVEPGAKSYIKDEGQNFIQLAPLPINPFNAQLSYEAGMEFKDDEVTIAKRVASIFKSVYEFGNQQFPILIDAIMEGIKEFGDDFDLAKLQGKLLSFIGDGMHSKASVQTALSKLKPFISSNPFSSDEKGIGWEEMFSDATIRNKIFQFHKVDRHSARALIEFVLWDLYAFVATYGNKDQPKVIVLDEIQNLDLGPDGPVAKFLTEGRKHGLALITATQTVKGVGGVSDAKVSRLFQADQKLFFKPTENEMREHAQLLHNAVSSVSVQDWVSRLAALKKGECWTLGRNLNESTGKLVFQAQRIKITSLEERGFNG